MGVESYKDILGYIAKNLVDNPDEVNIVAEENGDTVTLKLRVAQSDMGKVIGKQGRIAKEIRILLKSAGQRDDKRVLVDILD